MTIPEAISKAKDAYEWPVVPGQPTSVNIGFINNDTGNEDFTQLDLWGCFPEDELEALWKTLYEEFETKADAVTFVAALGYIV